MSKKAPEFKKGDEIRIVGDHPWRGQLGTVVGPADVTPFDFIVALERDDALHGHECYASAHHLKTRKK